LIELKVVKNVIIKANVPDWQYVGYILFEVWMMKNPNQLPLEAFLEFFSGLKEQYSEKIEFKGLEALKVAYNFDVGKVDIFVVRNDIVFNLRSGRII